MNSKEKKAINIVKKLIKYCLIMNFADYLLKGKKRNKKKIFINKKLNYSNLSIEVENKSKNIFSKYKNRLIGICLQNSPEFLVVYLSIIKSGNTAVIIEKGLSEERYYKILEKFKISFLITDYSFDKNIILKKFFLEKRIINNLNFYSRIKNIKFKKKEYEDVAVILFTSGSTGEKKGVMLTHKNLISNTNSILKILPIKSNDVVNLLLPASYSYGLSIINTHLKVEASIYLHNSPFVGSIIQELKKFNCTSFYGVPSTFEILLNKTNFINNRFPKIRYIAQAGGKLEKNYKKELLKKFQNKFYVMYGATEASPRLSYVPPKMLNNKLDSIGIPLPGIKFKLFKYKKTKYFQLGVSGKNIMKGYFNDKKLTRKSFKKKYFLTGDLASKDKENYYHITKRIDKTLKRYGYKINLDIIEKTINKISFIINCKLFFNEEKKLILVVQTIKEKFLLIDKINKILRKEFANYEIPDEILFTKKPTTSFKEKISLNELYYKLKKI